MMLMIDGCMAMWNAVLKAFCRENRAEYYHRCWRIVTGKAMSTEMTLPFVHNCLSHAMRAAKRLVSKHCKSLSIRLCAMYWISLIFSSTTLNELSNVMDSIIIMTNCKNNTQLIKEHFDKLKFNSANLNSELEEV